MSGIIYGLYEQIINGIIMENLKKIDRELVLENTQPLDPAESSKILAEYFAGILREIFAYIEVGDATVRNRVDLCNSILLHIRGCIQQGSFGFKKDETTLKRVESFLIEQDAQLLFSLVDKKANRLVAFMDADRAVRPETSISENSLFTGAPHEPSMVSELRKEILSSHRIDFLVSFIRWSGLRLIIDELARFTANGGKLRVLTTSYLGATDFKAVEQLGKLANTEIHISYDTERTRLHAKTYVFWRDTGFSTVYIGSSNISESAMTSGLEWNIKLSQYDSGDILEKIRATFEGYWNSPEFTTFIPQLDSERLRKALKSERRSGQDEQDIVAFNFDIKPYYYQQEILDKLHAAREVHHSCKNLIVAATGTGKTVIAAFDYRDFCRVYPNQPNRLLFVAHRKEILSQSLACFRGILKDLNFGSMLVGGVKPDSLDHLFISIQSFNSQELIGVTTPEFYDYIVIDEFHHAAASSYQELLDYYKPKVLLGLTATPERADGRSVLTYFEGRIAAEIRLWEAIERKLLSPFHYFGVTDDVDLSQVRWVGGKYDEGQIEKLYVFERAVAVRRAGNIIKALDRYGLDRSDIIGIGFCVTKKHAEFMSNIFNQSGIAADYLIAESEHELRENVKRRLVSKEIHFVFVVDIYNEGIDIPEVNTVLFLRPTESLTVFLQQLGRGLRLSEGKESLTVLDFVGQAHSKYSFTDRFKALFARTRKSVEQEVKTGFAHVPRGCSIQLEKQAQEYILANIRNAVNNKRNLISKLRDFREINRELKVQEFFEGYHVKPQDVYSKRVSVVGLAAEAGLLHGHEVSPERERLMSSALGRLSLADSRRWIRFLQTKLPGIQAGKGAPMPRLAPVERTMLRMFYYTVWGKGLEDLGNRFASVEEAIYWALDDPFLYDELMGLLEYRYQKIDFVDKPLAEFGREYPLDLHCSYTFYQILVALGKHTERKRSHFREGVLYLPEERLDVFFVTLNKSEKDYSPSTMYQDYSINEKLFHWQSQSRTTEESVTGRRYINQSAGGGNVLFFVREYNKETAFTSPYTCLGLADYQSHYGSAPISIVWKMREAMPGFVLQKTAKVW
ncbi:UvrABC system protein B [Peptococcaceae bacterium CEB3]|nr:UvrABC system protein B [Peptococcaceae bacterium CEB3]